MGGATGSVGAPGTSNGFSNLLGSAVDSLQSSEAGANNAALGVAAGTESLPAYMIQATQAEMSAELTVAVRNAAMTSLNQILGM
jgi:flagellar hook-basal body complex protein FliE